MVKHLHGWNLPRSEFLADAKRVAREELNAPRARTQVRSLAACAALLVARTCGRRQEISAGAILSYGVTPAVLHRSALWPCNPRIHTGPGKFRDVRRVRCSKLQLGWLTSGDGAPARTGGRSFEQPLKRTSPELTELGARDRLRCGLKRAEPRPASSGPAVRLQLRANSRRSLLKVSAYLGTMARPCGAPS